MKFYVIDIIGRHSGMHYYNESLGEILRKNRVEVEFLTNYSDPHSNCIAFFRNQFEGTLVGRFGRFIKGLFKLYVFLSMNKKDCFIYYFYGNLYEHSYIFPLLFFKRSVIDVHDLTSMASKNTMIKKIIHRIHKIYFRLFNGNVIIHNEQTGRIIKEAGFKGEVFNFPHLQYILDRNYNKESVRPEVICLINPLKINLLFFGYIRESKGPDIIIDLARLIVRNGLSGRFNLIIAGNDPQKIISRLLDNNQEDTELSLSVFLNYITDDELKYLFSSSDYVLLPYKEISQSGILEMAVHFRRPVITSNLTFFSEFLKEYKSFGWVSGGDNPEEYLKILYKLGTKEQNQFSGLYYSPDDLKKYENSKKESALLLLVNKIQNAG